MVLKIIHDGEEPSKALTYATISTATELATEKLLGGTTKALTGGSASALNQGIANGLGRILNNKTVINLLSHAGSEQQKNLFKNTLMHLLKI